MKFLDSLLERLSAFEPTLFPVVSLYLNTQPDQHGRPNIESFVHKEFHKRAIAYPLRSAERESFTRDVERIWTYLESELKPSSNGAVIFACWGTDEFFEAMQFEAPVHEHRLYLYHQPHLYPLARLMDQYPRYAVLIADTNAARLLVFGRGALLRSGRITSPQNSPRAIDGWSQTRYQRHVANYHLHHANEIVDALDRVVRDDTIEYILLAGDEVIIPVLRELLPHRLQAKLIDVLKLGISASQSQILLATLDALREHDAQIDAERVQLLMDAYRAGGRAVIGARDTLAALNNGQVDEVIISGSLEEIHDAAEEVATALAPDAPEREGDRSGTRVVMVADQLVTRARRTGARMRFIEDASLLSDVGGVGALLRYQL
jgi:peptide subunit release factor 1 (eRF1)